MKAKAFDIYTEQLRAALESNSEVVGLVTLGTTADSNFRDEWSDHDFWVITKAGAQDSLVQDLSWLPEAADIAITVEHAPSGRTVIYRNRHKVEFAVFDVNEAREGKIQRYRILIDRDQIADLIESIHQQTLNQAQAAKARPRALQNLCVLVWSACERYCRGEMLSARQYLDGFAVNQLLNLLAASNDGSDELDPRRRLELSSPELAAELLTILKEPVPAGALHLLEIAERELKPKAPTLAWENVKMVREWISELPRA
jgi:lincosamide nucleotidyltransferase